MKTGKLALALVAALLASAPIAPTGAFAAPFLIDRGIIGLSILSEYGTPDVSGDTVVYVARTTAPLGKWRVLAFNVRSGVTTTVASDPDFDLTLPAISGDWVVWERNLDIKAKNLKTGVVKDVTNDGISTVEIAPQVSGGYVTYMAFNGVDWDVKAKNLGNTDAPFSVADGPGWQVSPSISGGRVAYTDNASGSFNIRVKTLGSSAPAEKITDNAVDQALPSIGDHMIAWQVRNASGHWMLRYFDWYTGETRDGPTSNTHDVMNPQVSGDRILYDLSNGADQDLLVWDARVARTAAFPFPFVLAETSGNEWWGKMSGKDVVFTVNTSPYFARLAAPSITLNSVPKRIRRGARITLKGSISDQGHRIGKAVLGVERLSSGKWTRIKTITATSSGTFSTTTPKNTSKKQYRVVYDGQLVFLGATARNHLSAISSVRTAWPR